MLTDLKPYLDNNSVKKLISYCIFDPTELRIETTIEQYRTSNQFLAIGYVENCKILGFIGLDVSDEFRSVIRHISVDAASRGKGIGKCMIEELVSEREINHLEAETDDEAVGFYGNCGFEVVSLGEKYPGVKRYLCRLTVK